MHVGLAALALALGGAALSSAQDASVLAGYVLSSQGIHHVS